MAFFTGYNINTHYKTLMELCEKNEAFYFTEHTWNGKNYRIFNYRLASYTDFQQPGALECRGHTFLETENGWVLVSLPMEKFFNVGENPSTMNLDWMRVRHVEDKRDGSLISTIFDDDHVEIKSKGSFSSEQACDARKWLAENPAFERKLQVMSSADYTVNMEWTAPHNQIVLGYKAAELRVLNIRDNWSGEYMPRGFGGFTEDELVEQVSIPYGVNDVWIDNSRAEIGKEGYILHFQNGQKAKLKTDWYSNLHLQKDSVNNPRRLFESVIMEQSDDLKALFTDDPATVARITEMEVMAKALYNRLHAKVEAFYLDGKKNCLSRKDYAIKGQAELASDGVFSLAMNLYLGNDMGLKEHLIKNYKKYGIVDNSVQSGD